MFEEFRKQAEEAAFPDEDQEGTQADSAVDDDGRFLGLTAPQRFLVAFMLLVMTILLGALLLLVTSKVALPF